MKVTSAGVTVIAMNVFYDVAGISAQIIASYRTAGNKGQIKEKSKMVIELTKGRPGDVYVLCIYTSRD